MIKKFECKKVIISVIMIFSISVILIYYDNIEEISIKDYLKIKIAKKQAYADLATIDSLKIKMKNDANELFLLKAKLDSMITINSNNQIEFGAEVLMGPTFLGDNPGIGVLNYYTVSGANTNTHGTVLLQGNGVNLITAEVDGDGSGGVNKPRVTINNILKLNPRSDTPTYAEEGFIYYDSTEHKLKVFNGKKWENIIN